MANLKPQFVQRAAMPARAQASRQRPANENAADKEARVTARAVSHFESSRRQWVAARYTQLLHKEAPGPQLKPPGIGEDHATRLYRAATHLVEQKQVSRLDRIRSAGERLASGRTAGQIGR